ncbi:MAG: acyl-phosphate glycerol 3-phosphate acyltransferase [Clostridiales bacterium]|nr:acyl-phosphate glycerol 3-phosphate acyltransferase [Clostridiales bacterium]
MPFLCLLIGYVLGNFSTGMIVADKHGTDIRHEGSGNPGTTNVLRVIGPRAGIITFAGDFCKAVLAVLIGYWIGGEMVGWCTVCSSVGVICGHNWPALFGFKGGKGIACTTAVILLMFPGYGAAAVLICLAAIFLCRYVSLGSILMTFSFALMLIFTHQPFYVIAWGLVICGLCVWRHIANIGRLIGGTENRLSFKNDN